MRIQKIKLCVQTRRKAWPPQSTASIVGNYLHICLQAQCVHIERAKKKKLINILISFWLICCVLNENIKTWKKAKAKPQSAARCRLEDGVIGVCPVLHGREASGKNPTRARGELLRGIQKRRVSSEGVPLEWSGRSLVVRLLRDPYVRGQRVRVIC